MSFEDFNKKYNQLLAAPFDLKAPLNPIGLSHVCRTLKCNEQLMADYSGVSEEEVLMQKPHFASAVVVQITDHWSPNETVFFDKFLEVFPDFPDWWFSLPFTHNDGYDFSIIQQPPRRRDFVKAQNRRRYSSIHIDQVGAYGLRIYVNNHHNQMYLYELKKPFMPGEWMETKYGVGIYGTDFHAKDSNGGLIEEEGRPVANSKFHDFSRQFIADKDCVFFLNEARAAHCPLDEFEDPVPPEQEKFAIAVTIKQHRRLTNAFKWEELDKILLSSKRQHQERFVWASNYSKEKP